MTTEILIAGFGGQGILFAGKFLANKGLLEGRNLSWLPSYGPEMRGGTANCSVVLSDDPIGSPIVTNPDVLIVMNLPSLDKYENAVKTGGTIFVDSTLIKRKVNRTDVNVCYIPATALAQQNDMPTLANMIMIGKGIGECQVVKMDGMEDAVNKIVSARHAALKEINLKALKIGNDYKE